MAKSAFVAIVGRPSAGKSTLLNALCGAKVSIVSPVPQTTRNTVRGIVHRPEGQLVFLDTPGFHISEKKLNLRLRDVALHACGDADIVLYLMDASRLSGPEEEALAAALVPLTNPAATQLVIGLNKCDVASVDEIIGARAFAQRHFPDTAVVELSAVTNTGLDTLCQTLFARAEEGPAWYPDDYYTDQEPVFRIAEIVREKAILHTRKELPHAIFVDYRESRSFGAGGLEVSYDLVVERDSQKGILIGKGGSMIQRIREEAEAQLVEIFDYPVHLRLKVRVDPSWRHDDKRLASLLF